MSVKVNLYNIAGQKVMDILNQELSAGDYNYQINTDELSSGAYFLKTSLTVISAPLGGRNDRNSHTQKIVLMK
jgi:hypothetical protein